MVLQPPRVHEVSVVIPVYRGELTLGRVVGEMLELGSAQTSATGLLWKVREIILVHDHGPDASAEIMRSLSVADSKVRTVWLSRNFGQHAATLAGMASSTSEWVVTLDEDGQHDPRHIGRLLDAAMLYSRPVVYGQPSNAPPHGLFRNLSSRWAKRVVASLAGDPHVSKYQSYRLMTGEIARSIATNLGAGVYLDVALRWVAPEPVSAEVELRRTDSRPSGYTIPKLLEHFLRLILSGGTRGLRLVSILGVAFSVVGLGLALLLALQRFVDGSVPEGWTSTIVVILLTSGATLFSLGVIAEYLGVAVGAALGRPRYLIVSDPQTGPLGRTDSAA